MPAMSMPFEIKGGAPSLSDGDRIASTLVVNRTSSWLEDVRIIGHGGAADARVPVSGRAMPGAVVPDFPLLDQNGGPISLGNAAGRVLLVTFIYTRCPLPDLCPLMIKHLEHVRQRVNEKGLGARLGLLGITLDPAFDTPAVLRTYGESVLKGPDPFGQWTLATGTAGQVDDVASYFGVASRADGGLVTHTLATAVVSHDGRVVRTFASNSWRPDDVFDVVRRSIERAAAQLSPGDFVPRDPLTRSLAGAPRAPLRSRGSLAALTRR
jgi:protein SCO1/2